MENRAIVSVCCITYNQEKYIGKALEGMVSQKTDFPYEIIVHDDASTDGTPEIIREYAKKYDIIRPIYQSENQYSKKISIVRTFCSPIMKGDYIAFCEGDDYWTDPGKLQLMYDYMGTHPECSMCCHAYTRVVANTEEIIEEVHSLSGNGIIPTEQIIKNRKSPQLAATMFRKNIFDNEPELFLHRGIGDYPAFLYAAECGDIYYIDRVMSVYRANSDGSWSLRTQLDPEREIRHIENMAALFEDYDEYTGHRYEELIARKKSAYNDVLAKLKHDTKALKAMTTDENTTFRKKVELLAWLMFPETMKKRYYNRKKHRGF